MIRTQMNELLNLLKEGKSEMAVELANTPEYSDAISTLIDTGCVKPQREMGGTIVQLFLLDHAATYKLDRQELWINRIVSFFLGVFATVMAELLILLISRLL